MPRTHLLERTQFVPYPLEEVFSFFSNAGNLERLTPANLSFRILTPQPIAMQAGTLIDYSIRLFGVPMHWRTLIEEFEPGKRFVDLQLKGPYKLWHHTHEFTAVDGGTNMTDRVRYQMPLGPLGSVAHLLMVKRTLKQIFDFRWRTIEEIFPAKPGEIVVPARI